MDKSKLAEWGEKLKTGGAQMSRMVSGKFKEMLQTPTLESKMVDEATLETLEEPNWGMNMRICTMINSEEFNGTEIVKAIKRKISGRSVVSQRLSLDLLEACAMNCEKVFSEVASEKVLDEMVKLVKDADADVGNRNQAFQLIRAWGESEDLAYLPVFRQTYMSLQGEGILQPREDESLQPMQNSLDSMLHQRPVPVPPPGSYPIPNRELAHGDDDTLDYNFGNLSIQDKKEQVEIARNSLELLSSMLNTEGEPKPIKDDLTVSLMEKCRQLQPVIQMIIESTTDDEGLLFEALHLNDELQRVFSRYKELEAAQEKPTEQSPENTDTGPELAEQLPMKKSDETKEPSSDSQVESSKSNRSEKEDNLKSEVGRDEYLKDQNLS